MFYPENLSREIKRLFPTMPDLHLALDWGHLGVIHVHLKNLADERAYLIDGLGLTLTNGAEIQMTPEEHACITAVMNRFSTKVERIKELTEEQQAMEKQVRVKTPRSARIKADLVIQ